MKFIRPITINDSTFVSSTVAENDYAAWNGGTAYVIGNKVIRTATHRIYERLTNGTTATAPELDATNWLDIGPTNRWAMFDTGVGTVTSGATPLVARVIGAYANSLALLDLDGTSVQVQVFDGVTEVFDQTYDLPDNAELGDWYDYFFADIEPTTTLIVQNLPPYPSGQIQVTITAATTAACGTFVVGKLVTAGNTLANPKVSIIDYSRKETDDFGTTTVVARSYAKRIEAEFWFDSRRTDYVAKQLAAVRATPCVWLADDKANYESLLAYGFYRDWGINITYPNFSQADITIEGLT